jgi:hypothetical protein
MAQQLSTFVATVARVNDKGFKIAEGDRWLNWSRFAGERTTPPIGAKVNITLDGREFVQHVEVVQPATPAVAVTTVPTPTPPLAPAEPSALWEAQDARGKVVLREAVLNTATAILAGGGRAVDPAEVLALAAQLEGWVTRA